MDKKRNIIRKYIIRNASFLCLRENVSASYVRELCPNINLHVTLDSAMQFDIDASDQEIVFSKNYELKSFVENGKVIGITITDLQWNSKFAGNEEICNNIRDSFEKMISYLTEKGYKIIFIPQLFGESNDFDYMLSYKNDSSYILSDSYDAYFQQYLISKLYAVIGMRYHSNIFSAKAGTPFVSISYEQKMKGFMDKAELMDYCIPINDLCFEELKLKFDLLISNYDYYKGFLNYYHEMWKKESICTTDIMEKSICE